MWKRSKKNEQGFTFVEILTCLAIVALVVGPICFSFLSSLKTRVTAESINEATAYAERMLEDVKVQITDDIILRQMVTGNRLSSTSTYSIDVNGVGNYLVNNSTKTSASLGEFFRGASISDFNNKYNTDKYDYEMALWKMDDIPFTSTSTGKILTMDASTINKATMFYTDNSGGYTFDYSADVTPITFKASDEMLKAFRDTSLVYVPNQSASSANYRIMDKNTISLDTNILTTAPSIGSISNWRKNTGAGQEAIKVNTIEQIKNNSGSVVGYTFNISNGADEGSFSASTSNYRGIIELDTRALLRDNNMSATSIYDNLTFKFKNTTAYDQLIYVKQNVYNVTEASTVKEKFNIVAEDTSTGKSTIIRIDDIDTYENYVIAIIVREKNPALGQSGKIVKKLIDIFSYDVTANKRR